MPLKFYHTERLEKHIKELKELRYKNVVKLNDFLATPEDGEKVNQTPLKPSNDTFVLKMGDFWSGRDKYI